MAKKVNYSKILRGGDNKPTNPELWEKAKSAAKAKFDVYPSAVANAWASRKYAEEGGDWKKMADGDIVSEMELDAPRKYRQMPPLPPLQLGGGEEKKDGRAGKALQSAAEQGYERYKDYQRAPEFFDSNYAIESRVEPTEAGGQTFVFDNNSGIDFSSIMGQAEGGLIGSMASLQDAIGKQQTDAFPQITQVGMPMENQPSAKVKDVEKLAEGGKAGGGYRVVRTNERKGKTHKVIGPGGETKYFGDPNLKNQPQNKGRKEAFYARHAKSLAKNPFFRAYARATWAEGGVVQNYEDGDIVSMEPTDQDIRGASTLSGQKFPDITPTGGEELNISEPEDFGTKVDFSKPDEALDYYGQLAEDADSVEGILNIRDEADKYYSSPQASNEAADAFAEKLKASQDRLLEGAYKKGEIKGAGDLLQAIDVAKSAEELEKLRKVYQNTLRVAPEAIGSADRARVVKAYIGKKGEFAEGKALAAERAGTPSFEQVMADPAKREALAKDDIEVSKRTGSPLTPLAREYLAEQQKKTAAAIKEGKAPEGFVAAGVDEKGNPVFIKKEIADQRAELEALRAQAGAEKVEFEKEGGKQKPPTPVEKAPEKPAEKPAAPPSPSADLVQRAVEALGGIPANATPEQKSKIMSVATRIASQVESSISPLRTTLSPTAPVVIEQPATQPQPVVVAPPAQPQAVVVPPQPVAVQPQAGAANVYDGMAAGAQPTPVARADGTLPNLGVVAAGGVPVPKGATPVAPSTPFDPYATKEANIIRGSGQYAAIVRAATSVGVPADEADKIAIDQIAQSQGAQLGGLGAPPTFEEAARIARDTQEYKDFMAAKTAQEDALAKQLQLQLKITDAQTRIQQTAADLEIKRLEDFEIRRKALDAQKEALRRDIMGDRIDPSRMFQSTGANIWYALGAAADIFGTYLGGKGSGYMEYLDGLIKRDVDTQVANLNKKKGMLSDLVAAGNDLEDSYKLTEAFYKNATALQLEKVAAGFSNEKAKADAMAASAKMKMDAAKLEDDTLAKIIDKVYKPYQIKLGKGQQKLFDAAEYLRIAATGFRGQRGVEREAEATKRAQVKADLEQLKALGPPEAQPLFEGQSLDRGQMAKIYRVKDYAAAVRPLVLQQLVPEEVKIDRGDGRQDVITKFVPKGRFVAAISAEDKKDIDDIDNDATAFLQTLDELQKIAAKYNYTGFTGAIPTDERKAALARAETLEKELAARLGGKAGYNVGVPQENEYKRLVEAIPKASEWSTGAYGKEKFDVFRQQMLERQKSMRERKTIGGFKGQGEAGFIPAIPSAAVEYLKKNPSTAADFDKKFGAGSAAKILGK